VLFRSHNAQQCAEITDVVVDTDDDEILFIAQEYGAYTLRRPPELAKDNVTLDPVIYAAVRQMEKIREITYDTVITLQATSPLLQPATLSSALQKFLVDDMDTYISVINRPHLAWTRDESGYFPLYEKRLNRQQLPPNYLETGAFFITRRQFITENSRMGQRISVYEIAEGEAVDIDDASDWVVCESFMNKKKIVLRADGYKDLGMGHIYHCLTLAYNLIGHEVVFATNGQHEEGLKKVEASHFPLKNVESDEAFYSFLEEYKPDIVVNDRLDTKPGYIKALKQRCPRVITIEDMGEGARYADAVINTLYEATDNELPNVYGGEKYVCLRDEFLVSEPKAFSEQVHDVLVLFGGTDPCNLTDKVYHLVRRMHTKFPDIRFTILTGIGYRAAKNGRIVTRADENIAVIHNAQAVSHYMNQCDLAFTSQGRTVYELASLGIPSIVMAQNERERLHTFAQMDNGFLNLGLGQNVETDTLEKTFDWLVNTPQIRREMRNLMLQHPLREGVKREIRIILGE
jgi:spore coat polysaccharide biosynthesis predicted glycosyltransferase SpsG/CMP-N-acetylneuraminic acid synthetase